jgi:hypothetical protein
MQTHPTVQQEDRCERHRVSGSARARVKQAPEAELGANPREKVVLCMSGFKLWAFTEPFIKFSAWSVE